MVGSSEKDVAKQVMTIVCPLRGWNREVKVDGEFEKFGPNCKQIVQAVSEDEGDDT
jgi:hypothetical protein